MDRSKIEDLLWRATILCLGLDPDDESEETQKRVRISWPSAETGSTNWLRDENVVFLRLAPSTDPYGNILDEDSYQEGKRGGAEVIGYHRTWQVTWVCYGPDSDRDANMIRHGILRDAVRAYLREHSFVVQPGIPEPIRMPEPDETGEWWERNDVTADAYEYITQEYAAELVASPPDISITTFKG